MLGYGVLALVIIFVGGIGTAYLWWIDLKRYWLLMLVTIFAAIISFIPPAIMLIILPISFVTLVPIIVGGVVAYIGSRALFYVRIIIFITISALFSVCFAFVFRYVAGDNLWFLATLNSILFIFWLFLGLMDGILAISDGATQWEKLKLYATWSVFFVALVATLEKVF
jgi:hypothetical protein